MKVDGILLFDLLGVELVYVGKLVKKCKLCEVKYCFIDQNGEEKMWIGQGCMLKFIVNVLENGKLLDDFLI